MAFDFLGAVEALSPANLTIREQARLDANPNDLRWRAIFPYQDAPSVRLSELSAVDFRPIGGRREWNADGREIPELLGARANFEMVPINPTRHLDERRLQFLRERAQGVSELLTRGVVKDVDGWATALADAADRQIEYDAFQVWAYNRFVVMDPKRGDTVTVNAGIDASRYVAAATTLAGATNAFTDFMGYLADAQTRMGSIGAVRMRRARLNDILADAPAFQGDRLTLAGLQERINNEGYGDVRIVIDERTFHDFVDGGSATTTGYYVPADRLLFQPAGGVVGQTHFAPVTRAYDYMDPNVVQNIQDFTVFYSEQNDGKTLKVEAQANALPVPIEQYVYVVTGV